MGAARPETGRPVVTLTPAPGADGVRLTKPLDPITDLTAAQTFTAEHGFGRNRYGHGRHAVITYGPPDSPRLGKPRCACKVWGNYDYSQCDKVAKVALSDGTTWCGTHAPAAVDRRKAQQAARSAEWNRKFNEQQDARQQAKHREAAYPQLLALVEAVADGHNDPRTAAADLLGALGIRAALSTPPKDNDHE